MVFRLGVIFVFNQVIEVLRLSGFCYVLWFFFIGKIGFFFVFGYFCYVSQSIQRSQYICNG